MEALTIQALARIGAEARIEQIIAETNAILRAFPDLKEEEAARADKWQQDQARRRHAPPKRKPAAVVQPEVIQDIAEVKPTRKRKPMSAAARKATSRRMIAYWAARRAEALPARRK